MRNLFILSGTIFVLNIGCSLSRLSVSTSVNVIENYEKQNPTFRFVVEKDDARQLPNIKLQLRELMKENGYKFISGGAPDIGIGVLYEVRSRQVYGQSSIVGAGGQITYIPTTSTVMSQTLVIKKYIHTLGAKKNLKLIQEIILNSEGNDHTYLVIAGMKALLEKESGKHKIVVSKKDPEFKKLTSN